MVVPVLSEKYEDALYGVLSSFDRIIISGNLPPLCYAKGMTGYLYRHNIRIFDYTQFAEPFFHPPWCHPWRHEELITFYAPLSDSIGESEHAAWVGR